MVRISVRLISSSTGPALLARTGNVRRTTSFNPLNINAYREAALALAVEQSPGQWLNVQALGTLADGYVFGIVTETEPVTADA